VNAEQPQKRQRVVHAAQAAVYNRAPMVLATGTRLGAYEIVGPAGQGITHETVALNACDDIRRPTAARR
jgi:hypothetical protein